MTMFVLIVEWKHEDRIINVLVTVLYLIHCHIKPTVNSNKWIIRTFTKLKCL